MVIAEGIKRVAKCGDRRPDQASPGQGRGERAERVQRWKNKIWLASLCLLKYSFGFTQSSCSENGKGNFMLKV